MMKIKIVILFTFILFLLGGKTVLATSNCSYEDQAKLIKIAGTVKATYEEAQEVIDPNTYTVPEDYLGREDEYVSYKYYFKITINNIAPETYVKVINDYNDEIKYIKYTDTDEGSYSFDWKNIYQVVNFTLEVYSSSETACPDEKFALTYLTTPMYNEYFESALCYKISDQYYLCQKYITTEVSYEMFEKQVTEHLKSLEKKQEEKAQNNKKWYQKATEFVKKNEKYFLIGGSVIIVGGVVTTVVVIRKRKREII